MFPRKRLAKRPMKIRTIEGVDPQVRAALDRLRIRTTEGLWRSIGNDYPTGVARIANQAGVAQDEIAHPVRKLGEPIVLGFGIGVPPG